MNSRFHRSTREAFPVERFPAVFGPYRRQSVARPFIGLLLTLALFAFIGALVGAGF